MVLIDCSRSTIKGVTTLGNNTVLRIGNTGSSSMSLSGRSFSIFVRFFVAVRVVFFVTIQPLLRKLLILMFYMFLNYNALRATKVNVLFDGKEKSYREYRSLPYRIHQ
jgi:hypothetical protein